MLAVLRTRGYNLFCNVLTTSDLYFDLPAGTSFTVFVPTDSSLFALDMTSSASVYITALRYYIVPLRLSLADLQNLTSGSILPTLLPIHDIQVQRRPESENFTTNGVDVVPGLFFGRNIAVHGLGGILSFRTQIGLGHGSSFLPPGNLYNNQS
ncbi:Fasciclin-like arabinogalactan protein 19 [Camellia lanceoleosa]|nr:Fasciclin-like arabinogalactan protein 19 [Camellia lanceoleosa]